MTYTVRYGACLLFGDSPATEAHRRTLVLLWQGMQVPRDERHARRFLAYHVTAAGTTLLITTLN